MFLPAVSLACIAAVQKVDNYSFVMTRIFRCLLLVLLLFRIEGYISKGIFTGKLLGTGFNARRAICRQRNDLSTEPAPIKIVVTANTISTLVGLSTILAGPVVASAYAEPSAREALQLLSGYQTHTPNWFTWGTLAVLAYVLAFEIWKKVLAAW